MRKIIARTTAMLVALCVGLALTASPAQAQPKQLHIGYATVCSIVTFFDFVLFDYDCYTEGPDQ